MVKLQLGINCTRMGGKCNFVYGKMKSVKIIQVQNILVNLINK